LTDYRLEKIPHKRSYKIGEKFTIPSSSPVKIASYIDLENKGTNNLILLIEGKVIVILKKLFLFSFCYPLELLI